MLLKKKNTWQEDEEEDVSRKWVTLRKREDAVNLKRSNLSHCVDNTFWRRLWTCRKTDAWWWYNDDDAWTRWLTDSMNHGCQTERLEWGIETGIQRRGNGQFNVKCRAKYWLETGKTTANATIIGLWEIKNSTITKKGAATSSLPAPYIETSTYLPDHTTSDFTKLQSY